MIWSLGTFLDIAILVLLATTVLFAFRLHISLRNFKEGREEMEGLVNRLSANIEQAERAVGGMQGAARKAGLELDEIINDSKKLADELRMMNDMGNNLADRLEKLAEKNRQMSEPIRYNKDVAPVPEPKSQPALPEFILRDREQEGSLEDSFGLYEEEDSAHGYMSKAERELFEALQSGKTRPRGRA